MDLTEYRNSVRPAAVPGVNSYTLSITAQMNTYNGVAWTGDLSRDGVVIGTVEDRGDGGAPLVFITDPNESTAWTALLAVAYPGNSMAEEDFIAHLDFTASGQ